jgi:hypothetical protein
MILRFYVFSSRHAIPSGIDIGTAVELALSAYNKIVGQKLSERLKNTFELLSSYTFIHAPLSSCHRGSFVSQFPLLGAQFCRLKADFSGWEPSFRGWEHDSRGSEHYFSD